MASLDLQEQEQLDNLKAFWAKWGKLIQAVVTLGLLAFAGWNGWNWYQREQGLKASTAYEGVEQAVEAKDLDKAARLVAEMQSRFAKTAYTTQATLLATQGAAADKALPLLQWAATQGEPAELRELASLRLAGLHLEAQRFAEAKTALDAVKSPAYAALAADRRGDLALLQKDVAAARKEFTLAYAQMDAELPYRRLIEAKLMSVGVDPAGVKKAEEAK
jgi:predicted negative regulator of RcsB-dependent stress response